MPPKYRDSDIVASVRSPQFESLGQLEDAHKLTVQWQMDLLVAYYYGLQYVVRLFPLPMSKC